MNSKRTTNGSRQSPDRTTRHSGCQHIAAAAVLFVLFAAAAAVLLLRAAEMALAEWLGSGLWAAVVLGGVMALVALLLWLVCLRPAVARTSERVESLFAVVGAAGEAIDWVREKYRMLKLLAALIRSKW